MKHISSPDTLLFALAIDAIAGELPNQLHPVVWMGRWLQLGETFAPTSKKARLLFGGFWFGTGAALVAWVAAHLPRHWLVHSLSISALLAYRALDRAVGDVQTALEHNDLVEARRLLSWHLVSRPTEELRPEEVAAAAIESLAENLSDSLIAPVLAYRIAGLPGLAVYRFCNTADAMWGYRNQRYEQLGKVAARSDDLLNLVPARLCALLITGAAHMVSRTGGSAWRTVLRDHAKTASPNAGWPMASMAGALNTCLTKRDHYTLGDGRRIADAALMAEARTIARFAVALLIALLVSEKVWTRAK